MSSDLQLQAQPQRLLFAVPGNEALARDLSDAGAGDLGSIERRNFPDGETYARFVDDVAGKAVLLV